MESKKTRGPGDKVRDFLFFPYREPSPPMYAPLGDLNSYFKKHCSLLAFCLNTYSKVSSSQNPERQGQR